MTLAAGTKLGPYEVLSSLGAGGMGEVYRARDSRLGCDVAIKVLPASFATRADRLRRFEQEARAAGMLNHPNLTAVHDVGSVDGAPYVVEVLLEGKTLRDALSGGAFSPRKAVDVAIQIARGLAAAHDKGIVHRDLKPENVFVTRDGGVKILDFGLGKLTHHYEGDHRRDAATMTEPGVVLGTLGYMSPGTRARVGPGDPLRSYRHFPGRRDSGHGLSARDLQGERLGHVRPGLVQRIGLSFPPRAVDHGLAVRSEPRGADDPRRNVTCRKTGGSAGRAREAARKPPAINAAAPAAAVGIHGHGRRLARGGASAPGADVVDAPVTASSAKATSWAK